MAMNPSRASKCQPMSQSGGKLGRKQEEAIVALLSQRSMEDAARVAGVTPRTPISMAEGAGVRWPPTRNPARRLRSLLRACSSHRGRRFTY